MLMAKLIIIKQLTLDEEEMMAFHKLINKMTNLVMKDEHGLTHHQTELIVSIFNTINEDLNG